MKNISAYIDGTEDPTTCNPIYETCKMSNLTYNEVYFSNCYDDAGYYKMSVDVYDGNNDYLGSIIQDLTSSKEFYFDDELLANADLVNTSSLDLNEMKYSCRNGI